MSTQTDNSNAQPNHNNTNGSYQSQNFIGGMGTSQQNYSNNMQSQSNVQYSNLSNLQEQLRLQYQQQPSQLQQQQQSNQQPQMNSQQQLNQQMNQQLSQQHNHHLGSQQQPISIIDEADPSLVYDRSMKVAKTNYADHGTHGVAAVQNSHGDINNLSNIGNLGNFNTTGGPASSFNMQLQMQQMAAAMMQAQQQKQQPQGQRQQDQQQQQNSQNQPQQIQSNQQQYSMMPPPNIVSGSYPSLVPGAMGSQQFLNALAGANSGGTGASGLGAALGTGGGTTGSGAGGSGSVGIASILNATTSTGLIDALNAQIAAAAAASSQSSNDTPGEVGAGGANTVTATSSSGDIDGGGVGRAGTASSNNSVNMIGHSNPLSNLVDQQGNLILGNLTNLAGLGGGGGGSSNSMPNLNTIVNNLNNVSNISNAGWGLGGAEGGGASGSGTLNNVHSDMIAPGDIRSGKKRVSPSVPLHQSQLQLPNYGGGILVSNAGGGAGAYVVPSSNTVGMGIGGSGPLLSVGENEVVNNHDSSVSGNYGIGNGHQQQYQSQDVLNASTTQQGLLNAALQCVEALAGGGTVSGANLGQGPPQSQLPTGQFPLDQSQVNALNSFCQQQPNFTNQSASSAATQASASAATASVAAAAAAAIANMKGIGETLTNPPHPAANSGLDNADGNLIVRRGDVLRIPKKNMHSHPPSSPKSSSSGKEGGSNAGNTSPSKNISSSGFENGQDLNNGSGGDQNGTGVDNDSDGMIEYTVMSLLGQGTFAQVFHCIERETGKSVAVKIVKNKPAYTRQAAVEIDIFRKLNSDDSVSEDDEGGSSIAAGDTENKSIGSSASSFANQHSRGSGAKSSSVSTNTSSSGDSSSFNRDSIIRLMYYFMHCSHLCLVFEMLGPNLYELLKKRQFRGLPIGAVRTLIRQAVDGIKLLGRKNVVHCDLKPENILMVRENAVDTIIAESNVNDDAVGGSGDGMMPSKLSDSNSQYTSGRNEEQWIKLIDFGSACFEGQTMHTYIQSRFYRSPEVLIGLPYDSAIDMWSLGCVAAELFLGLPILPGVHEHDQLGRILEMIGPLPEWMLEQGSKSTKFFKNTMPKTTASKSSRFGTSGRQTSATAQTAWEFKTRQEYIDFLTEEERQSKGGLSKLEHQPTNRYFKKKRLEDIVMHHGVCKTRKEKEQLGLFVHFLKGVLDPDPWKRWTAHQASMHPFLTGSTVYRSRAGGEIGLDGSRTGGRPYDIHWVPPWDASICRRKLLVVQKTKEKSHGRRRLSDSRTNQIRQSVPEASAAPNPQPLPTQSIDLYGTPMRNMKKLDPQSPAVSVTSQMAAMADAMSLGRQASTGKMSPPQSLESLANSAQQQLYSFPSNLSASLGAAASLGIPVSYQQLADAGFGQTNLAGRSYSENVYPVHMPPPQNLHSSIGAFNDTSFPQQPPPPPPPTFIGAQSFSGAYFDRLATHCPYESDLGYALQRPGVVPAGSALFQRKPSSSSLGYLAQQSPMLATSWGNLSSTPNFGPASGAAMSIASATPKSPGGLLQAFQGLQENITLDNPSNRQVNNGNGGGTSLLAQQLAEYSESNQQIDPNQSMGQPSQPIQLNPSSDNQQLVHQQSFSSNMPSMYGSAGPLNAGSYHGGIMGYTAPPAAPMSLSYVDSRFNAQPLNLGQYFQSASVNDYAGGASVQQQGQPPPQNLSNMSHHNMQGQLGTGGQNNNYFQG